MSAEEFESHLGPDDEYLEKSGLRKALANPRTDLYIALTKVAENGDLAGVKAVVDRIKESKRGPKTIDINQIRRVFSTCAMSGRYAIAIYLASCFPKRLRGIVQDVAFGLASQGLPDGGNHELIKHLINADLLKADARDSDGTTLLHCAAKSNTNELVGFLLDNGANPFCRDSRGMMPVDSGEVVSPSVLDGFFERSKTPSAFRHLSLFKGRLLHIGTFQGLPLLSRNDYRLPRRRKIEKGTNWLRVGETDDMLFTLAISRASSLVLDYDQIAVRNILRHLSRTFLEQNAAHPHLRFRQPSYNTFPERLVLGLQRRLAAETHLAALDDDDDDDDDDQPEGGDSVKVKKKVLNYDNSQDAEGNETVESLNKERSKIVSIVMPYFCVTSKKKLREQRKSWGPDTSDDKDVSNSGDTQPFSNNYVPRTLDESYFVGLGRDKLAIRNNDQVISESTSSDDDDEKPILLVSQLWLWSFQNMVITACGGSGEQISSDPDTRLVHDIRDGYTEVGHHVSSLNLTAMILSECINHLDRARWKVLPEPIFYAFEQAVARISEDVQEYMKVLDMDSIRINQEKKFIHSINDIREELAMILNVVEQQDRIWNMFFEDNKAKIHSFKSDGIATRPNSQLPEFKRRVEKIDKDAERVQSWILIQLSLKGSHASLKETRNGTYLSTAAIGFTIISFIFTPLSFLNSIFALPLTHLQQQQLNSSGLYNDESFGYSTNFIGGWMTLGEIVSMLVTGSLVWLCFVWLKTRETVADEQKKDENQRSKVVSGGLSINDGAHESKKVSKIPFWAWRLRPKLRKKQNTDVERQSSIS